MINIMTQSQEKKGFFKTYKKWIVALGSIYLLPTILIICAVIGSIIYSYNSTYSHPYKAYIIAGFKDGFRDAPSDRRINKNPMITPWRKYKTETFKLKETVALQREEYLVQFPESERGMKLAEMKQEGIKLPGQQELEKRFRGALNFYADYVKKQVNRENYNSEDEYNEALQEEAWKSGYAEGYREGIVGLKFADGALASFKK